MRIAGWAVFLAALVLALTLVIAKTAAPVFASMACDPGKDVALTADAKAAVAGVNAFSLDLYKQTLKPDANQFLSPASVSTAVALAYRGAVGKTADELRRVLHYGAAPAPYLRANGQVFATMNFCRQGRLLQTANAIWVQDGMPLKPDYVADVQASMGAALRRTDFRGDPDGARSDINAWAASATHGRITDLLQPGDVAGDTRAVLVNAIYWKGRWRHTFAAGETLSGPFTQLDGEKRPTLLMHQRANFAVVERDGVQAIDLPYVGDEVSMVVFLPRSPQGLSKFEAGLTNQALAGWLDALHASAPRDTVLTLPKMRLEDRYELADTLSQMGAPSAFSDNADFSGMATLPELKISHVVHKAWLNVDEEGAEAAAATAATMEPLSTPVPPPHPIVFSADRPFLFALVDRQTGLILFLGRYVTPQPG
jgi:serpin B